MHDLACPNCGGAVSKSPTEAGRHYCRTCRRFVVPVPQMVKVFSGHGPLAGRDSTVGAQTHNETGDSQP